MGEMMTFDYYYGLQAEQYSFYRIPKLLFTHEFFNVLSCEAKVLYGLFLDRMSLSIKNKWFDGENRVYIIFSVEEVMNLMSCGRQKAVKIMMELDSDKGIGLTEKKRLGLGKANILYVKNFMMQQTICSEEKVAVNGGNTQKYENQTSGSMKIKLQEVPKSNFWSSLLRLLHMENPVADRVINNIFIEFSTGVIFTPFRYSTAAMGAVLELHYPVILSVTQGKKTSKTAPF